MKIIELLKDEGYPMSWIQGFRTRILLSKTLNPDYPTFYEVLSKSTGGKYLCKRYEGHDEEQAVMEFIKSEED